MTDEIEKFDYVIIGAGSAGCIIANRLSACGKYSVCVVEAGPKDWHPMLYIPAGFIKTLVNPRFNWMYSSEPSVGTNGRAIPAPRGKVLGGSSSINGMGFNRGQKMDFDVWAQKGNPGWSYDDILPYFKRFESYQSHDNQSYRGSDGEMTISDLEWKDPLCEAYINGAESMGIPRNPDYNGARQEGISYLQRTVRGRFRMSAARAFLNPAKKRSNLRVITNAHVTRILLEGKCATGITYKLGSAKGVERQIHAGQELILCAGAINSPHLLQISGIGAAEHLRKIGCEVHHDLPAVGDNFQDHYATRLTYRVRSVDTINNRARGLPLISEFAKYCFGKKSILNLGPTAVFCFMKSNESLSDPDIQINFTPGTHQRGMQSTLEKQAGFTMATWQHRPESQGYVKAKSTDPFAHPEIQPNYLAAETDQNVILAAIKICRKLAQTEALKPFVVEETFPSASCQNDDDLLNSAREIGQSIYHLMGTCRMGNRDDRTTVVDAELRVHGIKNLRVIDASIMPTMVSANLNAAVMMIAEKGADMVLGKTAAKAH
ncbi:GMC family oxidoreductase N-terminal domain-containing protein [Alphaproteobacteria bacterium]|nr:GMC family oxidoreductase N-terminal domain-containing protein [Alphaproteobacteria bacterium]